VTAPIANALICHRGPVPCRRGPLLRRDASLTMPSLSPASGCHSSANGDLKLILFIAVALWLSQIFQTLQENRVTFQSTHRASHSTSAFFAGGATGCFSYALLAILRPDYTLSNHMISDYAVGRFGWIMTTAFVATHHFDPLAQSSAPVRWSAKQRKAEEDVRGNSSRRYSLRM
jgi:hypothetical protein